MKEWQRAIEACQKSVEFHSGNEPPDPWFIMAMAHWQLGAKDDANTCFENATLCVVYGNHKKAGTLALRHEAEQMFGLSLGDNDRLTIALKASSRQLQETPDNQTLLYWHAESHYAAQNWQEAVDAYTRYIEIRPEDYPAYLDRSYAHENLGHHAEAMADANTAIGIDPARAWGFAVRALLHRKAGQFEKAIQDATTALRHDPVNIGAPRERSIAYHEL